MIFKGDINNKTDAEERYYKKITKDHNALFKYYKMNKDDSNISKMLSYINTFLCIVWARFFKSNKRDENFDETDSK